MGIAEDQGVKIVLPRPKSPIEQLLQSRGQASENLAAAETRRTLEEVRPLPRSLDAAGPRGEPGVLAMSPLVVEP